VKIPKMPKVKTLKNPSSDTLQKEMCEKKVSKKP
jgi:hypothetical protein